MGGFDPPRLVLPWPGGATAPRARCHRLGSTGLHAACSAPTAGSATAAPAAVGGTGHRRRRALPPQPALPAGCTCPLRAERGVPIFVPGSVTPCLWLCQPRSRGDNLRVRTPPVDSEPGQRVAGSGPSPTPHTPPAARLCRAGDGSVGMAASRHPERAGTTRHGALGGSQGVPSAHPPTGRQEGCHAALQTPPPSPPPGRAAPVARGGGKVAVSPKNGVGGEEVPP